LWWKRQQTLVGNSSPGPFTKNKGKFHPGCIFALELHPSPKTSPFQSLVIRDK
jgi:hypothetical protein